MPHSSRPEKFALPPSARPLTPRYDPAAELHRRGRNRRLAFAIGGLALAIYLLGFLVPH